MNYFDDFTWEKMLNLFPERSYNTTEYHKILHPDFPEFLNKYLELPILKRLSGIGLLCGTDWTKLYKNRFYYSRLDHSIGVALIIWHFTQNKAQTIAGLLHDVSTPVFSHVSDFRKGDALTQTATEEDNTSILRSNKALIKLLEEDELTIEQVENYHNYPIADNEIPQLSADRLEYMYPSGMALEGSWTLDEVSRTYNDITILKNENGQDELGFKTLEIAEEYCYRFCMTGHVLQLNENKLTLHLLGHIMNEAVRLNLLSEEDFMTLSEAQILEKLDCHAALAMTEGTDPYGTQTKGSNPYGTQTKGSNPYGTQTKGSNPYGTRTEGTDPSSRHCKADSLSRHCEERSDEAIHHLMRLYNTFRNMTSIEHTNAPKNSSDYFCVSLKVKQRYINPLVDCHASLAMTEGTDPYGTQTEGTDPSSPQGKTSSSTCQKGTDPSYRHCKTDSLSRHCEERSDEAIPSAKRLFDLSQKSKLLINDFLSYQDTSFGCVKLI